ncbi:MAG: hypothetical protein K1X53_07880 [Candidatus Sumerlaeaceae bacterium]|nr:hypothetical protein [Candidatus Sumerlaeaceae bacterium]
MRIAQLGVFLIVIGCGLLFVLFFPLLDRVTHPVSVLSGEYEPLIIRLPAFPYGIPYRFCLFTAPAVMVALAVLMQRRRFPILRGVMVLLVPFHVALAIQWFLAVQVDKYLWMYRKGYGFHWGQVFQVPFLLHCFSLALVYTVICVMVYGVVLFVGRKLSHRSNKPPAIGPAGG